MTNQMQITVTIGRGTGERKLSEQQWADFQADVLSSLAKTTGERLAFVETHTGIGVWEGVYEESAKITAVVDYSTSAFNYYSPEGSALGMKHVELPALAVRYGQDAIALTWGDVHLVKNPL